MEKTKEEEAKEKKYTKRNHCAQRIRTRKRNQQQPSLKEKKNGREGKYQGRKWKTKDDTVPLDIN